jgi:hypothetical protein
MAAWRAALTFVPAAMPSLMAMSVLSDMRPILPEALGEIRHAGPCGVNAGTGKGPRITPGARLRAGLRPQFTRGAAGVASGACAAPATGRCD